MPQWSDPVGSADGSSATNNAAWLSERAFEARDSRTAAWSRRVLERIGIERHLARSVVMSRLLQWLLGRLGMPRALQ
jgi:hypothetical protein